MKAKNIGNYGESIAAEMLESKNYTILERNFRIRGGEIDIIARDSDGRYIFAEVKTRCCTDYGMAYEYVNAKKQERIIKTAITYTGRTDVDMRFDIIEVYYENVNNKIIVTNVHHIENAF